MGLAYQNIQMRQLELRRRTAEAVRLLYESIWGKADFAEEFSFATRNFFVREPRCREVEGHGESGWLCKLRGRSFLGDCTHVLELPDRLQRRGQNPTPEVSQEMANSGRFVSRGPVFADHTPPLQTAVIRAEEISDANEVEWTGEHSHDVDGDGDLRVQVDGNACPGDATSGPECCGSQWCGATSARAEQWGRTWACSSGGTPGGCTEQCSAGRGYPGSLRGTGGAGCSPGVDGSGWKPGGGADQSDAEGFDQQRGRRV